MFIHKMCLEHLATAQPPDQPGRDPGRYFRDHSACFVHGLRVAFWHFCSLFHSSSSLSMPRNTRAYKGRQSNLEKARNSQKVTMEEVPDEDDILHSISESENEVLHSIHLDPAEDSDDNWELNLGNELPDIDCDNIPEGPEEPDLDEEIVAAPEITEESELDAFSQFLSTAQAAAQKAERAREAQKKRPKVYLGGAPRTKRRHNKRAKDLAARTTKIDEMENNVRKCLDEVPKLSIIR